MLYRKTAPHHNFSFQKVVQLIAQTLIHCTRLTTKPSYLLLIGLPCHTSEHVLHIIPWSAPNSIPPYSHKSVTALVYYSSGKWDFLR